VAYLFILRKLKKKGKMSKITSVLVQFIVFTSVLILMAGCEKEKKIANQIINSIRILI